MCWAWKSVWGALRKLGRKSARRSSSPVSNGRSSCRAKQCGTWTRRVGAATATSAGSGHSWPSSSFSMRCTPRGGHRIENELLGHECPDPALVAVAAPTRLVHVPHCFARQLLLPLLTGLLDRLADFLPSFLSAPQTDFQAQHIGQHRFHQPSRHPTNHRPVG